MPYVGVTGVSDARGARSNWPGVSVEKSRGDFGVSVASHGVVVASRYGVPLDKWLSIAYALECVLAVVLTSALVSVTAPLLRGFVKAVAVEHSDTSGTVVVLVGLTGTVITTITTMIAWLVALLPTRVYGLVFSWAILFWVRKLCVEKSFKGKLHGGADFAARILFSVTLFVATVVVTVVQPSFGAYTLEVITALFGALLAVPILHVSYGSVLGVGGVCFGTTVVSFAALISPIVVQVLLVMTSFVVSVYTRVSTQQVDGVINIGDARRVLPDIQTISMRLSLPVNSGFERIVSWQDMILLSTCGQGEPGGPKVRMAALVGDRILSSALVVHAFHNGWSVGRESSTSQLLLSNDAFAKVFDVYAADIVPTMVNRSVKRKGTFIEAFVGAAYLSGSLTESDLIAFMSRCVVGVSGQKAFD